MVDNWNIKDEIIDFSIVKEIAIKMKKEHPEATKVRVPVILIDSLETLREKIITDMYEVVYKVIDASIPINTEAFKEGIRCKINKRFGVEE